MKKQILIVEDENDCAELLNYHLKKENYQTVVVHNGKDAIDAVQRQTPDLILLDVMMPELSGWEVCRILRESSKGKFLPIIMITALSDEDARLKGLSLGADDYITKPYSIKELLLKVRKHVDREQIFKQLKVREQEQDTALRYMVHELKNSLNVIGGFSSVALKKGDPNKYLKTINIAASHADSLLNDVSLLSRLEAGREHLSLGPVNIDPLVEEAADLFDEAAKRNNIEIVILKKTTSLVRGNETAIRQIFINLIANAVKYNRKGGKVWISCHDTSASVDISIEDEGNGISGEDLGRIFEKYYRTVEGKSQKGAGLGLYIVKYLAEAMGGKVIVDSQLGAGSNFILSLIKVKTAEHHDG